MSKLTVDAVNAVLIEHGFILRKGDSRRITRLASLRGDDATAVLATALEMGLARTATTASKTRPVSTGAAERREDAPGVPVARLDALARGILQDFEGAHLGAEQAHEVAQAIVSTIRSPADLDVARHLFGYPLLGDAFTKGGKRRLADIGREWFAIIDAGRPDFGRPLVGLFACLDDAWARDGRPWLVTVAQPPIKSTFSQDNWHFMLAYALVGGNPGMPPTFGVLVCREEYDDDEGPDATMASLAIEDNRVAMLSAEVTRHDVGQARGPETDQPVTYFADMDDLCPEFAALLRGAARRDPADIAREEIQEFVAIAIAEAGGTPVVATLRAEDSGLRVVLSTEKGGLMLDERLFEERPDVLIADMQDIVGAMVSVRDVSLPADFIAAMPSPEEARPRQPFRPKVIQGGKTDPAFVLPQRADPGVG